MQKITRRGFLKALPLGLATYIFSCSGLYVYGRKVEMHRPVIDHVEIPIENLADDLIGFRIIAMGDLHIDPSWDFELIEKEYLDFCMQITQ